MFSVTAGDWVALSALILTAVTMGSGIVYRLGRLVGAVEDLTRGARELGQRVTQVEDRLERMRLAAWRGACYSRTVC